ncbi:MAG: phenylphosphate carboxylase subunit gamma [Deltaproteobacteria bacterium]|nr:phenylphosphate carboxylase subunit gamma [Deltaproteobacteria bacterium]
MAVYDTFILENVAGLSENQELVTVLRDLAAGKKKYNSAYAKIKMSPDPKKYPHTLFIRQGKGMLLKNTYSMEILSWISVIPEGL